MQKQITLPVPLHRFRVDGFIEAGFSRKDAERKALVESEQTEFCNAASKLVENAVGGWMRDNPASHRHGRDQFMSAAWLGVLQAYREFDSDLGEPTPFTIAKMKWRMTDELNALVGSQSGSGMRAGLWNKTGQVRKWAAKFESEHHRRPNLREASEEFTRFTDAVLLDVLTGQRDIEQDSDLLDPDTCVETGVEKRIMLGKIGAWLDANLSDRDKGIFKSKMLDGKTCEEVGDEYGITGPRVNQIVLFALSRIRDDLGVSLDEQGV